MSRGHGIIINYTSWAPFIFTYNPESVDSTKKINYATAPNIGGGYKKRYFSGFDSKEVSFQLTCVDMECPTGVNEEIAFFEALREPDPGITGVGNSFWGNGNFPPPQVLFQFSSAYIPLVWDVIDVKISTSHFYDGIIRGIIGIPKSCTIDITLGLVEDHPLNKANQIAKKVEMYMASVKSVTREAFHIAKNTRKELPGIFSKQEGFTRSGRKGMSQKW